MYQRPFLESNTHLLPFSPQSGVVGMNCWYGKSRDLFFFVCLRFFFSTVQGKLLLGIFARLCKAAVDL